MLNAGYTLSSDLRRSFLGTPDRVEFPSGTMVYRYTDGGLVGSKGIISPWWSLRNGRNPDEGISAHLERASRVERAPEGAPGSDLARSRVAISKRWEQADGSVGTNAMTRVLHARLTGAVVGWRGRAAPQKYDQLAGNQQNVVWMGGGWQVCLPNLTRAWIVVIGRS